MKKKHVFKSKKFHLLIPWIFEHFLITKSLPISTFFVIFLQLGYWKRDLQSIKNNKRYFRHLQTIKNKIEVFKEEIFCLLLTLLRIVMTMWEIFPNFVAFLEYMNFTKQVNLYSYNFRMKLSILDHCAIPFSHQSTCQTQCGISN